MSYFEPYIDNTGLHIPAYMDILGHLLAQFREIFGNDVHLEQDAQDYQLISAFASKLDDGYRALEMVYLNRSPHYAIGSGLDGIVASNGIKRRSATAGKVELRITGEAGTRINTTRGVVKDSAGESWRIDTDVEIGQDGVVLVSATCMRTGTVRAPAGTLTTIVYPAQGWVSVTNPEDATPGMPTESDEALRARNAQSVALPARSVVAGIQSVIASLKGVIQCIPLENDGAAVDINGIPAHSVCVVVEGGEDEEIANAIYLKKTPGSGTYGNTAVTIRDLNNNNLEIRFSRPQAVRVFVEVTILAIGNYTSADGDIIRRGIADYISANGIGETVILSMLFAASQNPYFAGGNAPPFSISSILIGVDETALATQNVAIEYDAYASCSIGDIAINVIDQEG